MATYLGNPSLSTAVKDRVMSTFEQALQLYKVGRTEEVVQGCGLILQMDPQFDPAKKLLEKARNPMAPIDIDKLVPAVTTGDALTEAREAMTRRDFQRVINITTEILTNDLMNEDARVLNDSAREKMEAAPFVEQFARKFDQSMANNDVTSARTNLEKARSLDPDHPTVTRMEKAVGSGAPAAPAPPPTPPPAAPPAPAPAGFSFDAPSFIVEAPQPAPGRGTAQASDFGFTFEEEKPSDGGLAGFSFEAPTPTPVPAPPPAAPKPPPAPEPAPSGHFSFDEPSGGGFSFDTPSPAPASGSFSFDASSAPAAPAQPPAASGEFDFSSASFETSDEDRRKIDQYLADGDRAYDSGDYQQAIDLWSRIFLIDVTNEPASDRIEKAKSKRRETEQKVEPLITAGVAAFDRQDYDGARQKFNEALSVDPANSTALDYIERMSTAVAEGGAAATISDFVPPAPEKRDIFADDVEGTYEVNIAPPPKAPAAEKKPAAKATAKPAKSGSRMGAVIAIVALAVLAGAGWFAYSKFVSKPPIDATATNTIFTKATTLAQQGKYDLAIAMLQDVKPEDPQHDRAVIMIADLQHKKSVAAAMIDGKPAAQYFSDQVNAGRAAYDAHDFEGAKRAFEQAVRVRPLPPDVKPLYDTSAQQVAKLDAAKSLFKEHHFADALVNLEQLKAQDPQNKNIERMIVDAHFNLGAAALQDERLPDAIKEFDEVLKLDPSDDLAKRSKELAARYNDQTKDLLFKIYVKYLPMRQVA